MTLLTMRDVKYFLLIVNVYTADCVCVLCCVFCVCVCTECVFVFTHSFPYKCFETSQGRSFFKHTTHKINVKP